MRRIGLTGGMGMGKSTAAEILAKMGLPVVDTDVIARQVVEPGAAALADIRRIFGDDLVGLDGRLRREELACVVFGDPAARAKLEAILHPRIRAVWLSDLEDLRHSGSTQAVVVIPLLFETRAEGQFDTIICVFCSAATQRQRLLGRGWTGSQIQDRLHAQLPIEQKITQSNHAIWNEGSREVLQEQLRRITRIA